MSVSELRVEFRGRSAAGTSGSPDLFACSEGQRSSPLPARAGFRERFARWAGRRTVLIALVIFLLVLLGLAEMAPRMGPGAFSARVTLDKF